MDERPPVRDAPGDAGLAPLLERLARGDRETDWAELIVRYGGFIRNVCQQHLHRDDWIDDAVQETLIRLQRALERFERRSEAEAWAWLRLIAAGCAGHILESEQARLRRERVVADETGRREALPGDGADGALADQKERLIQAMRRLTPLQCEILRRRFADGESNAVIAAALGLSEANVQKQGHRALVQLRNVLGGDRARPQRTAGMALAVLLAMPAGTRAPVATTGLSAAGWALLATVTAAGLVAGITLAVIRAPDPPAAPVPPVAVLDSPGDEDPATAAFIRTFQERHPGWRRSDAGDRLGDGSVWRLTGPWTVPEDGSARLVMANPTADLRGAGIALIPAADARTRARLLVATLEFELVTGRTGLRLAVGPSPATRTDWAGLHWNIGLTPDLLPAMPASDPGPAPARRMTVGIAVDRQDFRFLHDGQTRTQPLDPGMPVELALSLYGRDLAQPRTIVLHRVRVLEADQPPAP